MTSQSSLNQEFASDSQIQYVDRISVPPVDLRRRAFTAVILVITAVVLFVLFDYALSDYLWLIDNSQENLQFGRSVRDLIIAISSLTASAFALFFAILLPLRRIVIKVTHSNVSEVFKQI